MPTTERDWIGPLLDSDLEISLLCQESRLTEPEEDLYFKRNTNLLTLAITTSNMLRHFREDQKAGMPCKTSDEALTIIEAKFDLVFKAWSSFKLGSNDNLAKYSL